MKRKNKGFSLIEIVVVIAILAIIAALLVPALIHYTEDSRAQKDESTMDEVVNAVQLAIADPDCFDEMLLYACDNNFITYTDSSGKYGQQIIDAEYWAPDGYGRATTITFNPEKDSQGNTIYRLENAIVNDMTYGNGSVGENRQIIGSTLQSNQCLLKNAKLSEGQESGYLYNKIKQTIGTSVITTSATYSNSSFTIFIKFDQKDGVTVADVNGSFNGTNLDNSSSASLGSGTNSEVVNPDTGNKEQGPSTNANGGTTSVNFTSSALGGSGNTNSSTGKDYIYNSNAPSSKNGYLSHVELGNFVNLNKPQEIYFITAKATNGTDVSEGKNGSVLAWMEGNKCYVATTNNNEKVAVSNNGIQFNGETYPGYKTVSLIDVSSLDISKLTNLDCAFYRFGYDATNVSINGLDKWDTSNIVLMQKTFSRIGYNAESVTLNVSNFNLAKTTHIGYMFHECGYNAHSVSIGKLNNWNVSNVQSAQALFAGLGFKANTLDIGNLDNWQVGKVKDMTTMFAYCAMNAKSFNIGRLDNWDVSSSTSFYSMFYGLGNTSEEWNIGNLSNWNVGKATTLHGMFSSSAARTKKFDIGDLGRWNTSNVTDFGTMFANCATQATSVYIGDIGKWNTSKATSTRGMFNNFSHRANFNCDLSNWDVSNVTDMNRMFHGLSYHAETINLGNLGKWNVSKVTNMFTMFGHTGVNTTNLYIGDLSSWDVSSCENMAHMFESFGGYSSAKVRQFMDLSNWNTSNVKTMRAMFHNLSATHIGNLSNWDTSKVHDMDYMFDQLHLTEQSIVDVSSWDVDNVTRYAHFKDYAMNEIKDPEWKHETIGIDEDSQIDIDSNGNYITNY